MQKNIIQKLQLTGKKIKTTFGGISRHFYFNKKNPNRVSVYHSSESSYNRHLNINDPHQAKWVLAGLLPELRSWVYKTDSGKNSFIVGENGNLYRVNHNNGNSWHRVSLRDFPASTFLQKASPVFAAN